MKRLADHDHRIHLTVLMTFLLRNVGWPTVRVHWVVTPWKAEPNLMDEQTANCREGPTSQLWLWLTHALGMYFSGTLFKVMASEKLGTEVSRANGITATNTDHVSGTEFSTDLSFANAITSPYTAFSIPKQSVCQIKITITIQRIPTGWNTHLKPRCYLTGSINVKSYIQFSNNFTSVLGNSLCEAKTILD